MTRSSAPFPGSASPGGGGWRYVDGELIPDAAETVTASPAPAPFVIADESTEQPARRARRKDTEE